MDEYWQGASTAGFAATCVVIVLLLFIAMAISCQKPVVCVGPQGPAGDTGPSTSTSFITFSSGITNILNGNIIGTGYVVNQAQEFSAAFILPRDCTISRLYVYLLAAPSLSSSRQFTVRINGVDTALTTTISGSDTIGYDLTTSIAANAGDQISLQTLSNGTPAPSICEAGVLYA